VRYRELFEDGVVGIEVVRHEVVQVERDLHRARESISM
jgi:hypothetical protein